MLAPLLVLQIVLLLASAGDAVTEQKELRGTQTQEPNPTITASLKAIFSTLNYRRSTTDLRTTEDACCDGTCALGLCNYFYTPAPTPDTERTFTAAPTMEPDACCTAGCGDGLCRREKFPWRPHVPFPLAPGVDCITRSDCPLTTHQGWATWGKDGCGGRVCGAPTGRALEALVTIYPTLTRAMPHRAKPAQVSSISTIASEDSAAAYHAVELAGNDQDTLPIIVSGISEEPVTLLADIDLTLTENYISSGILKALGVSSTSPHPHQVLAIAEADRRIAALGTPALKVTPHANVSLDFLAGPKDALKEFADVKFNVFDLPPPSKEGTVVWQPEVLLGVAFLRDAAALRLAEDFAGNSAFEGVPVLVRGMKGYEFSLAPEKLADEKREERKKDEL